MDKVLDKCVLFFYMSLNWSLQVWRTTEVNKLSRQQYCLRVSISNTCKGAVEMFVSLTLFVIMCVFVLQNLVNQALFGKKVAKAPKHSVCLAWKDLLMEITGKGILCIFTSVLL